MPDLYIDGAWVSAAEGGTREIRCPADGQVVRVVDEATAVDTERAIAAARIAFDDGRWLDVPAAERGRLLARAADLLERDVAIDHAADIDGGIELAHAHPAFARAGPCWGIV